MSEDERPPRKFPLPLDRMELAPRRLVTPDGHMHRASGAKALPPGGGAGPVAPKRSGAQRTSAVAQRSSVAAGVGLDSEGIRLRMVQRLRSEGLRQEAVLAALAAVPRHLFVDSGLANQAYEDTSLPIGLGQTISKPSVVARMLQLLCEGANARRSGDLGRVLEIGTGCGYQAAVLSRLSRQVISVERLKPLHDKARTHLASMREHRIRLVYGDGRLGHPPNAPYDSIIAAAGGDALPQAWLEQLAEGGRLVAPRLDPRTGLQMLVTVDRTAHGLAHAVHETVLFVPLKSGLD